MDGAAELPGLGGSLAVSFISLAVVCAIAYVCLKFLARRGVGRASGGVRVVARCPLEPRRSLYVVEAAGRVFFIGVGDGPMTVLAELDRTAALATEAAGQGGAAAGRFSDVLARVLGRRPESATEPRASASDASSAGAP